jgi:hypothetical protein
MIEPDQPPEQGEVKEQAPSTGGEAVAAALTPEEQMAAYEESLKESDWGHQPC